MDGGAADISDHHNLVVIFDGYLMMPHSPEFGGGGLTFFEFDDPCNPTIVGEGTSSDMRESHSVGFSRVSGRWYAAVDAMENPPIGSATGIQIWDVTDPAAPTVVSDLMLPGSSYIFDAYSRPTLSVFWQHPYLYVGGADNGVYVVDVADPKDPKYVGTVTFSPAIRVGQVQAIGNLLVATAAEGPATALMDLSGPTMPQDIAGGRFDILDDQNMPRESYFSNIANGYAFYAIKDGGGGLLAYDIHDPANPQFAHFFQSGGNGGYVFIKDEYAFVGESNFAGLYDISDMKNPTQVTTLNLTGDLDTATPIGNVVVLSVDDEADANQGSSVAPYLEDPDTKAPEVTWVYPPDGATDLALTSRIGVSFNEFVEPRSAFDGSVRLYETDTGTKVPGYISTQEVLVNFVPTAPLDPDTSYTLEIMGNGVVDFNGNAVASSFTSQFTTRP